MHDEKFVDIFADKYFHEDIVNTILLLKSEINYTGKHQDQVIKITPFSKKYFDFINSDLNYEIMIAYNLDYAKAYLFNRIAKKPATKLIWNFFGTEIYNNPRYPFLKKLYGNYTETLIENSPKDRKKLFRFLKYSLKGRSVPGKEIENVIHKIDYFAWYSREEYNYLKAEVPYLPQFLEYPFADLIKESVLSKKLVKNKILLGNSRAPENNHLEILMLLEKAGYKGDVLIPFSYGSDSNYTNRLKEKIKSMKVNVRLLEEFIPYKEYLMEISSCEIAIFNSFRQMALGNVLISIVAGSKVYLSEKNISYTWLKNRGCTIFSVEKDLQTNLKNRESSLSEFDREKNRMAYTKLSSEENIANYLAKLKFN
jgi:hypothetical protein